jgi:hypothetical protein
MRLGTRSFCRYSDELPHGKKKERRKHLPFSLSGNVLALLLRSA